MAPAAGRRLSRWRPTAVQPRALRAPSAASARAASATAAAGRALATAALAAAATGAPVVTYRAALGPAAAPGLARASAAPPPAHRRGPRGRFCTARQAQAAGARQGRRACPRCARGRRRRGCRRGWRPAHHLLLPRPPRPLRERALDAARRRGGGAGGGDAGAADAGAAIHCRVPVRRRRRAGIAVV
ncbi:MAG: hypothetical protein J3K34DRAFT_92086 [Monoraphidium minutum]|nr:MAG: hypothetical protein J3K34DRAFT_92086 [Monoraphidium minutum]